MVPSTRGGGVRGFLARALLLWREREPQKDVRSNPKSFSSSPRLHAAGARGERRLGIRRGAHFLEMESEPAPAPPRTYALREPPAPVQTSPRARECA